MTLAPIGTTEIPSRAAWARVGRIRGAVAICVVAVSWPIWFGWRLWTIEPSLVPLAVLLLEVAGAAAGIAIAIGLAAAAESPRSNLDADRQESHRFPHAVGEVVGRTRSDDLKLDLRDAVEAVRRRRSQRSADIAMAAVLLDGPRRLALVVTLSVALLVGTSPMPLPPALVMVAGAAAVVAIAGLHIALAGGHIRPGDRLRWSYAALGETLVPPDIDGVAPRRWVGTVATVVVLNLAIALRGISDRWTHGLSPMSDDDRLVAMMLALLVVVGALYALRTSSTPELDNAHLVSRRLEEGTARQLMVGMAVGAGLVGLIAGIFAGGVDAADDDAGRVEHVTDFDADGVERAGG